MVQPPKSGLANINCRAPTSVHKLGAAKSNPGRQIFERTINHTSTEALVIEEVAAPRTITNVLWSPLLAFYISYFAAVEAFGRSLRLRRFLPKRSSEKLWVSF